MQRLCGRSCLLSACVEVVEVVSNSRTHVYGTHALQHPDMSINTSCFLLRRIAVYSKL